ncbi:hypothetical protein P691DRAFT_782219 [Macrolepiota fuliginosa MF-IS2]|uniref:Uncharacterized protein n=1 Tax=Macrolepiota fuliginosa MF-IS2 TaxID=1400762 RepID=A0A9P5WY48_9AGAR|nr:hypothetical protein P691DRAFT_782219 [Macrolepiota fuliginosa MF-IS2]
MGVPPDQFLKLILPPELLSIIWKDDQASLFFSTCDGPFTHSKPLHQIQDFVKLNFWLTVSFLSPDFHPSIAHTFMIQLVEHVFLKQNSSIFPNLLEASFNLGASLDGIMMMKKSNPAFCKISWVNHLYSPAGISSPPSCESCGVLVPWILKPAPHHPPNQDKKLPGVHPLLQPRKLYCISCIQVKTCEFPLDPFFITYIYPTPDLAMEKIWGDWVGLDKAIRAPKCFNLSFK